jgi:hypothetical protein
MPLELTPDTPTTPLEMSAFEFAKTNCGFSPKSTITQIRQIEAQLRELYPDMLAVAETECAEQIKVGNPLDLAELIVEFSRHQDHGCAQCHPISLLFMIVYLGYKQVQQTLK